MRPWRFVWPRRVSAVEVVAKRLYHPDQRDTHGRVFPNPFFYQRTQEMRTVHLAITAAILAVSATAITAQEQAIDANASQGQAAIDRAATAQKYVFLFF